MRTDLTYSGKVTVQTKVEEWDISLKNSKTSLLSCYSMIPLLDWLSKKLKLIPGTKEVFLILKMWRNFSKPRSKRLITKLRLPNWRNNKRKLQLWPTKCTSQETEEILKLVMKVIIKWILKIDNWINTSIWYWRTLNSFQTKTQILYSMLLSSMLRKKESHIFLLILSINLNWKFLLQMEIKSIWMCNYWK